MARPDQKSEYGNVPVRRWRTAQQPMSAALGGELGDRRSLPILPSIGIATQAQLLPGSAGASEGAQSVRLSSLRDQYVDPKSTFPPFGSRPYCELQSAYGGPGCVRTSQQSASPTRLGKPSASRCDLAAVFGWLQTAPAAGGRLVGILDSRLCRLQARRAGRMRGELRFAQLPIRAPICGRRPYCDPRRGSEVRCQREALSQGSA